MAKKKDILTIPSFLKDDPIGMRESKRPGPQRPNFMIKKGRPTSKPSFMKKSYANPVRNADTSQV
jgi:hypothetical protein